MKNLRFAKKEDFSAILEIYRPYIEDTTVSFEYDTPTLEQFSERLINISKKHPVIVYEEDNEVLGYAYSADPFERKAYSWCAELSVYVKKDCRGRGIGKKLTLAVEELARELGYRKMYSLVTDENEASLKFHAAMGYETAAHFKEQGFKFGRWIGVVWLEKELNGEGISCNCPAYMPDFPQKKALEVLKKYE